MPAKAAIVIGVDSTGNLARLESAAAGAQTFAAWLEEEGYDVQCLTDADGPVTARQVEEAVARFVTMPPRYALLVVYFSGHGSWHARADRWLLSGAPVSTTEAINLDGAVDLAQYSGIPNIVFISDACRSIPDSRAAANVRGIDAFPNYAEISTSSKVDSFMATSQARAAYALSQAGRPESVLSILHFMRGDLGVDLFDVRLLAARRHDPAWQDYPMVPACPMLTQSWNLLRPRGMHLAPALQRAMPWLSNALWTTFQPEAAAEIINAMTKGEL